MNRQPTGEPVLVVMEVARFRPAGSIQVVFLFGTQILSIESGLFEFEAETSSV
jgi:hypothetical protein